MTHTPGDWYLGCDGGEAGYQVLAEDRREDELPDAFVVCSVNACMGMESKANARLIAAAPDLLEACQKLVNEIDWTINNVAIAGQYQHLKGLFAACSEAREAIARATDSRQ